MKEKYILSVMILFFTVTSCGVIDKWTGNDKEKIERLKKEGVKCQAEITNVEDMNVTINKDPMVRLFLSVKPKGEPPFDAQVEMLVSRVKIPRAGDYVNVYYNPNDKTDLIVE